MGRGIPPTAPPQKDLGSPPSSNPLVGAPILCSCLGRSGCVTEPRETCFCSSSLTVLSFPRPNSGFARLQHR